MPESSASSFVLDTFAVLAYLQGERSGARVHELLQRAQGGNASVTISIINLGEVLYITERKQGARKAQEVLASIRQLPIEIMAADEQTVFSAAHIRANYAVSYADAFAIATAQSLGAAVITGGPEFEAIKDIVRVWRLPHTE